MAYAITTQTGTLIDTILRPFAAIGRVLAWVGSAGSIAQSIEALNATSDAELAARGTTRKQEVERIIGAHMLT